MTDSEGDTLTIQSHSVESTVQLGEKIGRICRPGDVIALIGELGAGKTQFIRGLVGGLNGDPRQVSSPTFIMMCEYEADVRVVHIDAYRISGLSDLESIGYGDELLGKSIAAIEWADLIARDLPVDHLAVEIQHGENEARCITLIPRGPWQARLVQFDFKSDLRAGGVKSEPCRKCGQPASTSGAHFPFCSERCRLADLNSWFEGENKISRPMTEDDLYGGEQLH